MKRIGISMGDINGIGPEVVLKAVADGTWADNVEYMLYGPVTAMKQQARALQLELPEFVHFRDVGVDVKTRPGEIAIDASLAAEQAIRRVVDGCLSGDLDAMVTAPICKEGFHKAGIDVPGHTELLAELTGTKNFGMMLMGGGLRVMLVTRHIPISAVAGALNQQTICEHIELTGDALKLFGLHNGTIGVCGLNPHAGDGGILGREEIEIINPAVETVRKKGYRVSDAVPADTIFYEARRGDYDAVVAMYHDQGLAPLKMMGFDEGINITLGLPIIRTSPDHGTAFGIAGKGEASAKSMRNAIKLAAELAGKPNPWK